MSEAQNQTMEKIGTKEVLDMLMPIKGIKNPTQLAELTGVPQPTISRVMSGKHANFSVENALIIAHFFGVTIGQLVGDEPILVSDLNKIMDEFFNQLDWFYKNLSDDGKHALAAHANLLWSVENPSKSNTANPFLRNELAEVIHLKNKSEKESRKKAV